MHHGHIEVARTLLNSGAHVCAIDLAKMTPLHHACMQGSEDCAHLLLEQENSRDWVDSKDISGCTPLLYCLNAKNKPIEKASRVSALCDVASCFSLFRTSGERNKLLQIMLLWLPSNLLLIFGGQNELLL